MLLIDNALNNVEDSSKSLNDKGSCIEYERKIFRKTNISNFLIRTRFEILVFREILRS